MQENAFLARESKFYRSLSSRIYQVKEELSKKLEESMKNVQECNNQAKNLTAALEQAKLSLQK